MPTYRQYIYVKTTAPTANDDVLDGYVIDDRWVDTTNDRVYVAIDVSTGAAIWIEQAAADGWNRTTETWTRTGNHTFTISGDVTTKYRKGAKLRYKDGGSYEYGVIKSSSYGAPNTTITLFTNTSYTMAAATITDTYISDSPNPEGFPSSFNYTATWNNLTAGNGTFYAKFEIDGTRVTQKAGFVYGTTTSITGDLNLTPIATPNTLGTTQEYLGATTVRDTGTALFEGTVYLIGGNLYPQISASSGSYAAPTNVTSTVPMTWASTDEISMICNYSF